MHPADIQATIIEKVFGAIQNELKFPKTQESPRTLFVFAPGQENKRRPKFDHNITLLTWRRFCAAFSKALVEYRTR